MQKDRIKSEIEISSRTDITTNKNKAIVKLLIKIVVSVFVIVYLFLKYDILETFGLLLKIKWTQLAVIIIITILSYFVAAFKWKMIYPYISIFRLVKVNLIGQFYSLVLPGQLFGEAAKIVYLRNEASNLDCAGGTPRLAASVVMDKITGLIGLLIIGGIGLLFSGSLIRKTYFSTIVLIVFTVLLISLILLRFPLFINLLSRIYKGMEQKSIMIPVVGKLRCFTDAWAGYSTQPRILIYSVMSGIVYQSILVGVHIACGLCFNISLPFIDWSWILCMLSILVLLPLSIGGIGIREGGYIAAMSFLNISAETALAFSLLMFSVQILFAVGGLLILVMSSLKKSVKDY